jgi:hypothetical protein
MLRLRSISLSALIMPCLAACCCDATAATLNNRFTPGHIYTPVSTLSGNARIVEWDLQLNKVREIPINAEGTTGAVFNDRGNLVVITRRNGNVRIVEYDAGGNAIDEYVRNPPDSLLLGSYIDYDPVQGIYAFADDHQVTVLDGNLNFVASSDSIFDRASGVDFAADGTLYVSDQ